MLVFCVAKVKTLHVLTSQIIHVIPVLRSSLGGGSGRKTGRKGAGGVREAGEEGTGSGIPKVTGSSRKREKLRNIAQYFAVEKMQRRGSQKIQGGNQD